MTLFGALNCIKNVMTLLISSTSWLLGFLVADIIYSLLDDAVMDLLSGGGRKGHIKMTSFSSVLFSFGETIGLTCERDENQLVWANDSCNPQI